MELSVEPMGMQDTFYIVPDAVRARIVRSPLGAPFAPGWGSAWARNPRTSGAALASGGVYSTAMDMAIFGQCSSIVGATGR